MALEYERQQDHAGLIHGRLYDEFEVAEYDFGVAEYDFEVAESESTCDLGLQNQGVTLSSYCRWQ